MIYVGIDVAVGIQADIQTRASGCVAWQPVAPPLNGLAQRCLAARLARRQTEERRPVELLRQRHHQPEAIAFSCRFLASGINEADINGDGVVNSTDRSLVKRQNGRKIASNLPLHD